MKNIEDIECGAQGDYGDCYELQMDRSSKKDISKKKHEELKKGNFEYYLETFPHELRVVELQKLSMPDREFWRLVRKFWGRYCYESKSQAELLIQIILSDRVGKNEFIMQTHERNRLEHLPSHFWIYRGLKIDGKVEGCSWSLSQEVARRHAIKLAYDANALLLRGRCSKVDVIAYFQIGGYDEQEIVIDPSKVRSFWSKEVAHYPLEKQIWKRHERIEVKRSA